MTPSELKAWREAHGWTQQDVADLMGVSRVTVNNWENGVTPISGIVVGMCQHLHQRWLRRPECGPVTLIYADGPMWLNPYGPNRIPKMERELHRTNEEALHRVCGKIGNSDFHNPLIMNEAGDVVWSFPLLAEECERRKAEKRGGTRRRR